MTFDNLPELFCKKDARCKHEANPQENNNAEAQAQQSRFATLLKSHSRTDTPTDMSPVVIKR